MHSLVRFANNEKFGYCDGVKARPRPRRSTVAEIKMTGDAESHELTEWQVVGWIY